MSDDNLRYFEAFPNWLRSLAEDAVSLGGILAAESTPTGARRCITGGLNYLFKSLDLVPDGIDDIGYLDDAFVLRVASKDALANEGAKNADLKGVLERLAAEVALVETFLGADYPRLASYVKDLQKGAARGRTAEDIVNDAAVRKEFVADVSSFARGYSAPTFTRDEKTLVKLRAFLGSRLPAAK
jgi:uncharacterized membrane protein YkvA (DUF1232 family)